MGTIVSQHGSPAKPEVILLFASLAVRQGIVDSNVKKTLLWTIPPLVPIATVAAALVLALRWIESDDCRALLEQKTQAVLHAEAKLAPLNWRWFGVSSRNFNATGRSDSALKQVDATDLQATLSPSSMLRGIWGVKELSLDKLKLRIGSPEKTPARAATPPDAKPSPQATGLQKWMPSLVVVEVIHGRKTDLLIEIGQASVTLDGTALEARPDTRGEQTLFKLSGGRLGTSHYPDLKLNLGTARCLLTDKGLDLTGAEMTAPGGGTIRLRGMFPSDGTPSTLSGTWEKLPVAVLLPHFGDKVTGGLSGDCTMKWAPGHHREGEGSIRGDGITLTGIPAFIKLAELTGLEQFRHLPVQTFSTRFTIRDQVTEWKDIVFESLGFLKITGEASTALDGSLTGLIRLGITTRIVNMLPFARELLGLEERDGYIWVKEPIILGGTLTHPTDSFTPRLTVLVAAGAQGMVREGVRTGLGILGIKVGGGTNAPASSGSPIPAPVPSAATNAVKTLEQGAGAVLDTLGGFLK
jgi:hypothetical protein